MVKFDPWLRLPSSDTLPCSDDTPVDNEDQNFIPNFLLFLLEFIWAERNDWFFAVDMGLYHTTGVSPLVPVSWKVCHRDGNRQDGNFPLVPDGFLSLGVERRKRGKSRKSYVVWEEEVVPILVLEVVSWTPGGEYDTKAEIYAKLGVLYYIIYNPEYWQRDRHQPFEVYRLVNGSYQLQIGEPYWMPEVGLGIGRSLYQSGEVTRELLYWYDQNGKRLQPPEELLMQERKRAERAEQILKSAITQLLATGLTPEQLAAALGLSIQDVNAASSE